MQRLGVQNKLSSLEKPKEFILFSELFNSEGNQLLTSTFKLKRNVAKEYFQQQIGEMYAKVEAAEAARAAANTKRARTGDAPNETGQQGSQPSSARPWGIFRLTPTAGSSERRSLTAWRH